MRVNQALDTIKEALGMKANCECEPETNRRGNDDDKYQMKADLIADDRSPFTGEDEYAMDAMSEGTMKALRDHYLKADDYQNTDEPQPGQVQPEANQETAMADEREEQAPAQAEVLTNEDRAALDHARKVYAEHRNSLISKITANTDLQAEALEEFETAKLETIANGIRPVADYSGRAVPMANSKTEDEAEIVANMTPPTTAELIKSRKEAH